MDRLAIGASTHQELNLPHGSALVDMFIAYVHRPVQEQAPQKIRSPNQHRSRAGGGA
jgi:hypothetical protein